jgi:phosphatidylserine/phosphatidylglycerophosphate/cardiolipin synthase-like enzyme
MPDAPLDVRTLIDGGQPAEIVADRLIGWLGAAERSLDLALYDVRLPGEIGDRVAASIKTAAGRGVAVRIAFNLDAPRRRFPPPPRTQPSLLEALGVPVKGIPGEPDLMHHKYVVRDRAAVWTGSTNWTLDSWTREENVLVAVHSREIAAAYQRDFEQLWSSERVEGSGDFDTPPAQVGSARVRPWFSPGRGPELSHRIAKRIGAARRRVRIASPVLTAGPILGTLNEVLAENRVDVEGVCDATQITEVLHQWRDNPRSRWKIPLLVQALEATPFAGKRSTPYAPDAVHDYMHAKITVADDTTFIGSFNLSRSGEQNAENVLEIADPALADRMAAYIDEIRARYPLVEIPSRLR